MILQLTFREGWRLFDPENPEHMEQARQWNADEANHRKPNAFSQQTSFMFTSGFRIGDCPVCPVLPSHSAFYTDCKFGAAIAYIDYIRLLVLVPECIASVQIAVHKQYAKAKKD